RRAWLEIDKADRILFVVDATEGTDIHVRELWPEFFQRFPDRDNLTLVFNKIDRVATSPPSSSNDIATLCISAKTGLGLAQLKNHLKNCMGYDNTGEGNFMARRRHLDILNKTMARLRQGQ